MIRPLLRLWQPQTHPYWPGYICKLNLWDDLPYPACKKMPLFFCHSLDGKNSPSWRIIYSICWSRGNEPYNLGHLSILSGQMIHLAPICQNREISGEISSCWTGSLELPYYVLLYYYIATLYSIQYTHKVPNSSPLPFYHHSTKYGSSYSISYVFQKDTPLKTNIGLWKTHYLKMYFLLNMGIFYCHVSFRGMYIFNLIPNPLQPQPPVFPGYPPRGPMIFFPVSMASGFPSLLFQR